MARAAEDAGADVLVEVARDVLDHEADLGDRPLQLHGGAGPSRSEREEDVAAPVVERLGGAREEEGRARGRVGRIGEDGVEGARQLRRQRPAEVVLDARDRERRVRRARARGTRRARDRRPRPRGSRSSSASRGRARAAGARARSGRRRRAGACGGRRARRPRGPRGAAASFVSTVQWHWSSSSRAGGPPRTARESSRTSGESAGGTTIPRPPQPGHAAVRPTRRPPAAKSSRPAGVSRVGRSSATIARLRSSPQTAATIGTGSSAARLMRRVEIGSSLASVARTARTPRSPSASPTAAATSPTMRRSSAKRPLDAANGRALDVEAARGSSRSTTLPSMAPQVSRSTLASRELGPRVDAEVRLREQEHARDRAVREGVERLADDGRAAGVAAARRTPLQLVRVGQDGGVAHPRVHRVEAHRLDRVVRGRRPAGPAVELEQSVSFAEVGVGRQPGRRRAREECCSEVGSGDAGEGGGIHSHQDAPPSTVA